MYYKYDDEYNTSKCKNDEEIIGTPHKVDLEERRKAREVHARAFRHFIDMLKAPFT